MTNVAKIIPRYIAIEINPPRNVAVKAHARIYDANPKYTAGGYNNNNNNNNHNNNNNNNDKITLI